MLQIRDVMTRHVFTVTPETTLREVADLFARHHISGAPVLAGHRVVGVATVSDLVAFIAANEGIRSESDDRAETESEQRMREEFDAEVASLSFNRRLPETDPNDAEPFRMDEAPSGDPFNEHTVDEVMTRTVCSLPPDAAVGEAARYMWQAGIHRLLVMEEGCLAGILTTSDIARLAATN
jgi:predicted transcriptional regulator